MHTQSYICSITKKIAGSKGFGAHIRGKEFEPAAVGGKWERQLQGTKKENIHELGEICSPPRSHLWRIWAVRGGEGGRERREKREGGREVRERERERGRERERELQIVG